MSSNWGTPVELHAVGGGTHISSQESLLPEAYTPASRRPGGRIDRLAPAAAARRWRRAYALAAALVAASTLAVVSPAETGAAPAQAAVPLDASCAELNAIVGRPTNASIVHQGVQFVSDSETQVGPGRDNRYSSGETVRIQVKLNLNARWGTRDDLYDEAQALHVAFMLGDTERQAPATPVEGEDSNLLTFEYTLESDDGTHSAATCGPENSVVAMSSLPHSAADRPYGRRRAASIHHRYVQA